MSGRFPATVSASLAEFARHGGLTGPHKDGWGIAFYDEGDVQVIRDTASAGDSIYPPFILQNQLRSDLVLAHIRRASVGLTALKNTQPFSRELGGRMHVFVHNGDLEAINNCSALAQGSFRPVGDTDSELAFCLLLGEMQAIWQDPDDLPTVDERLQIVRRFAEVLRPMGPANFIYADGEYLFAHSHKRSEDFDQPLDAPGLYYLQRQCRVNVLQAPQGQQVILFASVPLNAEAWTPLKEGEILVAGQGEIRLACRRAESV